MLPTIRRGPAWARADGCDVTELRGEVGDDADAAVEAHFEELAGVDVDDVEFAEGGFEAEVDAFGLEVVIGQRRRMRAAERAEVGDLTILARPRVHFDDALGERRAAVRAAAALDEREQAMVDERDVRDALPVGNDRLSGRQPVDQRVTGAVSIDPRDPRGRAVDVRAKRRADLQVGTHVDGRFGAAAAGLRHIQLAVGTERQPARVVQVPWRRPRRWARAAGDGFRRSRSRESWPRPAPARNTISTS